MTKDWHCEHFERTGLYKPRTIEKACKVCPLRNDNGDCPLDIEESLGTRFGTEGLKASKEIDLIWRAFDVERTK